MVVRREARIDSERGALFAAIGCGLWLLLASIASTPAEAAVVIAEADGRLSVRAQEASLAEVLAEVSRVADITVRWVLCLRLQRGAGCGAEA